MPIAPKHPCNGCQRVLLPRGVSRCPRCQGKADERERERRRDYDQHRRPAEHSVYSTPQWRAARARFLTLHPQCDECGKPASHVDHTRPWRSLPTEPERLAAFWNEAGWAPKCVSCHARKTAARDGGWGNPRRNDG